MSPRIVLTAAAILAVAAIAFVFTAKSGNESQSAREIPDSATPASVNQGAPSIVVPAEQPETREGPDAAREAAPSVAWAGKITDEAGQPLPAAELSWGALLPRFTGADVQVYSDHGQALAEHLVLATTDSEGRFRMERAPEGHEQHGSVLWITSSGFEAQAVILAAGGTTRPGNISLRKQEGVRVRVRNLSSEAVADAQVQQFLNPGGGSAAAMLEPERAARRLYMRSARTGPDGECVLPLVTGMFQVYARKEALQSAPCFQEGAAAIQLILAPCCRVEGRVVLPCSGLPREGAYLALYGLQKPGKTDGMILLTGRIMFREDGSFGPLSMPLPAGMTALRLRGAGGPLLETYLDRPMPAAGDSVYLTMELLLGEKLGVEVVDEGGKPVESAQVQVSVNPTWNTFVNGSFARTDGKGGTQLAVPGTQAFFISAWSEGLAPATVGPMLHSPGMSPVRIELLPAGGLRVRLFRHGEAVTKYRLNLWQGDPRKGWQEACENPEGLLTLADLAPGSYSVQASAEEWPQTRPQTLTIKAGEIADCELMIPEPVPARGRVVDALTGEPLPQARVMLHNSVGSSLSWPRDIEIPLDSQGGFTLPQVGEAGGAIMVSAEGYAVAVENYRWDPTQGEMARVIALQKKSPVVVQVSHRGGEPLKGYHVSSPVGMSLTPLPLAANGRLELPAQSPSSAMVSLHMPDGSTMSQWIAIASQPMNIVRFTVGGTASLEARLGTGEATRRLVGGEALLRSLERAGEVARSMRITRGDAILMQGLEPGEYTLELRNASDAIAASMPVRLRDGQRERIEVALNASDIELSIVDRDGLPLSGVKAEVVGQEPGAKWFLRGITDVRGRILLGGVTAGRALLALDHEELGMRRGLEVELRAGVNEVRFEAGERLEVLLTENGEPRPGVVVLFEHPGHSAQARSKYSSDEHGMIRTQRCNDGNYRIIVRHLGYWQEERDVSIPSKGQTVLALRPLGDVRLVALDRYGKEQGGVEIELSCTGLDARLESWISAGRVAAPPGGLRTGENGELMLRGLPAAEYRFRARAPSGESAEGTFQLPGRSEARVELPLR